MIQLVFDARDARRGARSASPVEVGYSQHEGAERADWGDDKLELVDGTHPVVYPAAGSHANFFDEALYLGQLRPSRASAATTRAARTLDAPPGRADDPERSGARPRRRSRGSASRAAGASCSRRSSTARPGPNLKTQWTEPITWSEDWRDRSYRGPGRRRVRDRRDRLLLRRGRERARTRSAQLLANPAPVLARARGVLVVADRRSRSRARRGARRAAPARPPPRLGPDPRGLRAHVRRAAAACSSASALVADPDLASSSPCSSALLLRGSSVLGVETDGRGRRHRSCSWPSRSARR